MPLFFAQFGWMGADGENRRNLRKNGRVWRRDCARVAHELHKENDMSEEKPDLLYGLAAIAEYAGLTIPQVKWQIERSGWPTFKQGAIVCARRSTLAKHFEAQERAAREAGQ